MRKEILDFAADLPAELRVEGRDAFDEHGRYLLFIEMIGAIAKDLCLPEGAAHRQEAAEWLADPTQMQMWCDLIDAAEEVVPILRKAIEERPKEIERACENMVRNVTDSGSFTRFMDAMGIKRNVNQSSLASWADQAKDEPETFSDAFK